MFRLQHLTENLSDVGYYKDIASPDELKKYHECYTCNLVYTDKNICDLCYARTVDPKETEPRSADVNFAHQKLVERQRYINVMLENFTLYLYQYATQTNFTKTTVTKVYELRDGERVLIREDEDEVPVHYPDEDSVNETVMGSIATEIITTYSQEQEFININAYGKLLGPRFTYITIHEEKLSWIVLFMRLTSEYINREYPANNILYFNNIEKQMDTYITKFPNWKDEPNTFYEWVNQQYEEAG